jgi:hypothetical protein
MVESAVQDRLAPVDNGRNKTGPHGQANGSTVGFSEGRGGCHGERPLAQAWERYETRRRRADERRSEVSERVPWELAKLIGTPVDEHFNRVGPGMRPSGDQRPAQAREGGGTC